MELVLKNRFKEESRVVLYGAGTIGKNCLDLFKRQNCDHKILCFVDADPQKWGGTLGDKKIESPQWLRDNPDTIVITSFFQEPALMLATLENLGVVRENIWSHLFFFSPRWFIAPGMIERQDYVCVPHKETGIELKLSAAATAPKEKFLSQYDCSDPYTRDYLALYTEMFCAPEEERSQVLFQPYSFCENFMKGFQTFTPLLHVMFWADCLELVREPELTICDVGAHTGDTLANFHLMFGGRIQKIYAIEPDRTCFEECQQVAAASYCKERISCLNFGCGDEDTAPGFVVNDRLELVPAESGDNGIAIRRLDSLGLDIAGKLCLKIHFRGDLLPVLRGARRLIETYKPHIAVPVHYHIDDVWKVPEYIKSVLPEYRCIIRGGWRATCYASVQV